MVSPVRERPGRLAETGDRGAGRRPLHLWGVFDLFWHWARRVVVGFDFCLRQRPGRCRTRLTKERQRHWWVGGIGWGRVVCRLRRNPCTAAYGTPIKENKTLWWDLIFVCASGPGAAAPGSPRKGKDIGGLGKGCLPSEAEPVHCRARHAWGQDKTLLLGGYSSLPEEMSGRPRISRCSLSRSRIMRRSWGSLSS